MRDTLASKVVTYGLLAVFVIMVAVPLFWMVTTAIKTNKELYEDFSYLPQRPTLENFVRVIVREKLLTNIRNSFSVALITTLITVIVSSLAAFSIVRYRYRAVFRGAGPGGWRCEELSGESLKVTTYR